MSKVIIKKKEYKGWNNCFEISNGIVDVVVTTDVGPRIIRYGFIGKKNMFCEVADQAGSTGGNEWRIYGGHRLWHSPESKPRSYEPDNSAIDWKIKENGIVLTQPVEPWAMIQKEIEVTIFENSTKVEVLHRLTNKGAWEIGLSAWSLTVMAAGGKEIMPQVQGHTALLPNRMISLWPYTRMNDNRVYWGEKYIMLQQDEKAEGPFKIGFPNEDGWAAYINDSYMFVKKFEHKTGAEYPDYTSSYETYTNNFMVEMESLSPFVKLAPDATIEHIENWMLFDNIKLPGNETDYVNKAGYVNEAGIDENILPLIKRI